MRAVDWQQRFYAFLFEKKDEPFQWGVHDCVTFAHQVAEVVTGKVFMIEANWADEETALRSIELLGGIEAAVAEHLGPPVPWGWCSAGDIVLTEFEGKELLAVHDGVKLIGPGETGLRRIPFKFATVGWRL